MAMEQARGRQRFKAAIPREPAPDTFPGYQVTREIHRGGQGVVYQAIHKSTKRKIAIKVMREGPFVGPKDKVRFEREVEILSALNHPNIVAVHDSGVTLPAANGVGGGLHYFVMDYVSGQSLDTYVLDSARRIDEVLALFAKICDAVNAAHLKGVVHRDLKPGNIRVDAGGEPHILDFGLAKTATGEATTSADGTPQMMTMTGQFLGSLPWASPEQAEGNAQKIDIRSDVYSLGVILYQMLTGKFPYQVVGAMRDVLDNILRAEPAKPSTVRRQINDEVETIVLKCLSKERERRYQSAGELARDLRNYLTGQPIEAKRDSGLYVLTKTLSRYKVQVLAAAAVLLAIVVGGGVSFKLWRDAEAALKRATEAEQRESKQAKKATAYADYLDKTLTSIDPDIAQGRETVLVEGLLTYAATHSEAELREQPEVLAAVDDTVGRTYLRLDMRAQAEVYLSKSLNARRLLFPGDNREVADSLIHMGVLRYVQGKYKEAEDLFYRPALAMRERMVPVNELELAEAYNRLGETIKYQEQSRRAEAEEFYKKALAIRERHEKDRPLLLAETLNDLGMLYYQERRYTVAEPMLRKALTIRAQALVPLSIDIANSKANLGSMLRDRGNQQNFEEAERLLKEALKLRRQLLKEDHDHITNSLNKLGMFLNATGKYSEAEAILREVVQRREPADSGQSMALANGLVNLGVSLRDQGKLRDARAEFDRAMAIERQRNTTSEDFGRLLRHYAELELMVGDFDSSQTLASQAIAVFGDSPADLAITQTLLARAFLGKGNAAEAATRLGIAKENFVKAGTQANAAQVATCDSVLGEAMTKLGRNMDARSLLESSYEVLARERGRNHKWTLEAAARCAEFFRATGDMEAEAKYVELAKPTAQ